MGNVFRQIGRLMILCWALIISVTAAAEDVRIVECAAQEVSDGLVVRAQFEFELAQRFESLLKRGIPLYFVTEFNVKRSRWYWWDETVIDAQYQWRLSFHALTRRYRLSRQNQSYNFNTLDEALAVIRHLGQWKVADKPKLSRVIDYQAFLRFRLDETQLPKLFQATPMMRLDWRLSSDWQPCRLMLNTD